MRGGRGCILVAALSEVVREVPMRLHLIEELASVEPDLGSALIRFALMLVKHAKLLKPADLDRLLLVNRSHLLHTGLRLPSDGDR